MIDKKREISFSNLKKYDLRAVEKKIGLNNLSRHEGSAMFIVLVTMSVLIILASSLFYSLNAEYYISYEETKSEQAYQTALSVNDWVYDYIGAYMGTATTAEKDKMEDDCPLLYQMIYVMSDGETITTSDGMALDGFTRLSSDGAGERYKIEIYRDGIYSHETNSKISVYVFKITTSIQYADGSDNVSFTRTCRIDIERDKDEDGKEYFEYSISTVGGGAATGTMSGFWQNEPLYFGTDVSWSAGLIANELSIFGDLTLNSTSIGFSTSSDAVEINVYKNLISNNIININGGIIRVGGYFESTQNINGYETNKLPIYVFGDSKKTVTGKDYTFYNTAGLNYVNAYCNGNAYFGSAVSGSTLLINGDLTTMQQISNTIIKAQGNVTFNSAFQTNSKLFTKGNAILNSTEFSGVEFFIDGDLIINASWLNTGIFYVKGDVHLNYPSANGINNGSQIIFNGNCYRNGVEVTNITSYHSLTKQLTDFGWVNSFDLTLNNSEYLNQYDELVLKTATVDDDGNKKPQSVPEWDTIKRLEDLRDEGDAEAIDILDAVTNNSIKINTHKEVIIIDSSGYIKHDTSDVFGTNKIKQNAYTLYQKFDGTYTNQPGSDWDPSVPPWGANVPRTLIASESGTYTIIIDTMAKASNPADPTTHKDIYIKLCDNSGTNANTFSWKESSWETDKYLNIIIRGAGNVIFFLDNQNSYDINGNEQNENKNVSYKAASNTFIGHEGWVDFMGASPTNGDSGTEFSTYTGIPGQLNNSYKIQLCSTAYARDDIKINNIKQSIHSDGICAIGGCIYCPTYDSTTGLYPGRHLIRQDSGSNLINYYIGKNFYLHNNIFLVDNSKYSNSNFISFNDQYFCFIYAPYTNDNYTSSDSYTTIVGGMILNSLKVSYGQQIPLVHLMPCDYYYPSAPYFKRDILTEIIGASPGGGTPRNINVPSGYGTIGYD